MECKPNIQYRTKTVKDHKDTYSQIMYKDAVTTDLPKYGHYFVEKEKEENL